MSVPSLSSPSAATDDPGSGCDAEADQPPSAGPHPAQSVPCDTAIHVSIDADHASSTTIDQPAFERSIRAIVQRLPRRMASISVAIVDDRTMSSLHAAYLNDPATTDVLTFPLSGPDEPLEVDIAICLDEARRRAAERGHTVEMELLLYVIHGLLHCTGYDDQTPADADRMHREEDRLLGEIGLGPVYHAPVRQSEHDPEIDR